jgi:hypothetical protein
MSDRKYQVRGTTAEGDTWTFATDHKDRAEAILAEMGQDLDDVELIETVTL